MFKERISTPVNPLTRQYVDTLNRPRGEYDYVLTMLGIVCFKPKVEKYCGISGTYMSLGSKMDALEHFCSFHENDRIEFSYYVYNSDEIFAEQAKAAYENLTYIGFVHKESVENIAREKFNGLKIDVLYNTNSNSAVVFTNLNNLGLYHLILSWLPLYYPNIYRNGINRNDPEVKVLSALSKQTSGPFKDRIAEYLEPYRFEFYSATIAGLINGIHKAKVHEAEAELQNAKQQMETYRDRYATAVKNFRDRIMYVEGLKVAGRNTEEEKDLIDYVSSSKEIRNVTVEGTRIKFSVATTLRQFSTDAWDIFVRNGDIFKGDYGGVSPAGIFADRANLKKFLNSIFSENAKFEVKIAGNYILDLESHIFNTNQGYDYELIDPIYADYLPNPHLKIFGCLGQYHEKVVDRLFAGDVVTALELCVYSAGSVDLDETHQTFRPFIGWIISSKKKILRREDGTDMTPEEAMVWLLDQEKGNE